MKREVIILFVGLILLSSSVSALNVICSEGKLLSDLNEIKIGDRVLINGLGIAVTDADETNAIGRLTADLIVDASKAIVSNNSYTQEIILSDGTHTINFANITGDKIIISVDGNYLELYKGYVNISGNLLVSITDVDNSDASNPAVKVIVGYKELTLLNTANLYEKVEIGETNYIIELYSASDFGATLQVYKCDNLNSSISVGSSNSNEENETAVNETQIQTNQSLEVNESVVNNTNNETNDIIIPQTEKRSVLGRFWDWIKNLFS